MRREWETGSGRATEREKERGPVRGRKKKKKHNTRERYKLYSEVIATHRCLSSQNEDYD